MPRTSNDAEPAPIRSSPTVPDTASEHPAAWKFDFPIYHPSSLDAWRKWLEHNHLTERGVWVASWRKASGHEPVPYPNLVEEAICFGWIDSTVNLLDDNRGLQLMTPRKTQSAWTRLNRRRFADLEARGLMTEAGWATAEAAKANGYWTIYDPVEDLIEPAELKEALDAEPAARANWDAFPPSARKLMLWWVISGRKAETQTTRIAKIIDDAAANRRSQG